ncbi:MAG TPA: NAD(P)-dependent oxidoreductase [Devosia sp.]|nr:NAD(P)-dependent oxidoreductase [Devosia sp.]
MPIKTVAFIGAGNMGAPMARNARAAGFDILVCDRNPAVLDQFRAEGVRVTDLTADCAGEDAVVVLLANDQQILATLTGPGGLADAVSPGHVPLICLMSTTLPDTLAAIKGPLADKGARLIDAPVSGGIVGAQEGTLSILMGGPKDDVDAAMPLMQAMGKNIFHCGNLGAGEVVKIINNIICIANIFLTAEVVQLAEAHGVSYEALTPIMSVSTGLNFLTRDAAMGRRQFSQWAKTPESYRAVHDVVAKDLRFALALSDLAGVPEPLTRALSEYVDSYDPEAMKRWMAAGRVGE